MYVSEMIVARSLVLLPVKSPCIPSWRPFEGSETGDNVSLCVFNISRLSLADTLHMITHWTLIGQTGFYGDPSSLGFTSIFDSDHHHCLPQWIVWSVSHRVLCCSSSICRKYSVRQHPGSTHTNNILYARNWTFYSESQREVGEI